MREYLFTIVCVAVVDLLTYFISCSASNSSFDRYIKIALKICMLSVIIYPIVGSEGLDNILNEVDTEERYIDETVLSENSLYILEKECEEKLCEDIFQKTGIKVTNVSIQIERKEADNGIRIKTAKIIMPKKCEGRNEELKKIVTEALKYEAEIIYDG